MLTVQTNGKFRPKLPFMKKSRSNAQTNVLESADDDVDDEQCCLLADEPGTEAQSGAISPLTSPPLPPSPSDEHAAFSPSGRYSLVQGLLSRAFTSNGSADSPTADREDRIIDAPLNFFTTTPKNLSRFAQRIGPVFAFENAMKDIFLWKSTSRSCFFLACFTLICMCLSATLSRHWILHAKLFLQQAYTPTCFLHYHRYSS